MKKNIPKPLKILVTAGPTREFFDPVRFLSNPSTGKMGYALAEAARALGHRVTLISGPTLLSPPARLFSFQKVVSARDMYKAVMKSWAEMDIIIMTAAVSDYRPAKKFTDKVKKTGQKMSIDLVPNPDILATLGKKKKKGQILVGFAAETQRLIPNALSKLQRKNLDYIVVNDVKSSRTGFETDQNEAWMISSTRRSQRLPFSSKKNLARKILALCTARN